VTDVDPQTPLSQCITPKRTVDLEVNENVRGMNQPTLQVRNMTSMASSRKRDQNQASKSVALKSKKLHRRTSKPKTPTRQQKKGKKKIPTANVNLQSHFMKLPKFYEDGAPNDSRRNDALALSEP
jgi:hypothetical protein